MKFHQAAFTDILLTHQTPRCTLQYTLRKARALPHTHSANAKQIQSFFDDGETGYIARSEDAEYVYQW